MDIWVDSILKNKNPENINTQEIYTHQGVIFYAITKNQNFILIQPWQIHTYICIIYSKDY